MNIRAICPKSNAHRKFITTVHVAQEWIVNDRGDWEDTMDECTDVVAGPTKFNIWQCEICGAEADVFNMLK
jgi:hypothetical protein